MISVRVNGEPLATFKNYALKRSVNNSTGQFTLTSSASPEGDFPVKKGDFLQAIVDGDIKLAGYVDRTMVSATVDSRDAMLDVRDITQDLIDSSIPDSVKTIEGPISLQAMCENIILALNVPIGVTNLVTDIEPFSETDIQSGETGGKCMEYIQSFAKKRQVFITPSGTGNIVLYRPVQGEPISLLTHTRNANDNNIKRATFVDDDTDRFGSYSVKSQDNFSGLDGLADYSDGAGTNNGGISTDSQVRPSRYLEIVAEETMTPEECTARAEYQANLKRSNGVKYTCTVAGHSTADGTVYDFGQFHRIRDELVGVQGVFFLSDVVYNETLRGGDTTELTFTLPDAYTVQGPVSANTERTAEMGNRFSNKTGQAQVVPSR